MIESQLVGNEMWCNSCDSPLSFRNILESSQKGPVEVFKIKCYKCHIQRFVRSTSIIYGESERHSIYAVNVKAAAGNFHILLFFYNILILIFNTCILGMIDAGIDKTSLNSLLTAINVKPTNAELPGALLKGMKEL